MAKAFCIPPSSTRHWHGFRRCVTSVAPLFTHLPYFGAECNLRFSGIRCVCWVFGYGIGFATTSRQQQHQTTKETDE